MPELSQLIMGAPFLSSGLAPSSSDRCWQVLLQVGYHSAAAKSIEIVVCMGEDSWAQQTLAFELLDTALDLTGGVDGG